MRTDVDIARETGLSKLKNGTQIPAEITLDKNGNYLSFNLFFCGFDILTAHLIKSDEYVFGVYNGATFCGIIYPGEKLSHKNQVRAFDEFFPKNFNDLKNFVRKFNEKIDYYESKSDSYKVIGKLNEKEIIQQLKSKKK